MKVHLHRNPTVGLAGHYDVKCGKLGIHNEYVTEDRDAVTCEACVYRPKPAPDLWHCKFCTAIVSGIDVCIFCGAAVCTDCDEVPLRGTPHLAEKHRDETNIRS